MKTLLSEISTGELLLEIEKRRAKSQNSKISSRYLEISATCKANNLQPIFKHDFEDGYNMVKNSYFWLSIKLANGEIIDMYDFLYGDFGDINVIPPHFNEDSESHYEFRGPKEKAVDILKACGYIEFKE